MKLKKGSYYNRNDFVKHVCTIILGRYLYCGTKSISFLEVAEYLNTSTDNLRMRKSDSKVMEMLKDQDITVKKIKGKNHFVLEIEEFHFTIDEDTEENNTIVI